MNLVTSEGKSRRNPYLLVIFSKLDSSSELLSRVYDRCFSISRIYRTEESEFREWFRLIYNILMRLKASGQFQGMIFLESVFLVGIQ